ERLDAEATSTSLTLRLCGALPPAAPCAGRPPNPFPFGGTLMSRVIEVTVSPQGDVAVQTKGYAGIDCRQASQFLEQALGVVTADRPTAELYETTPTELHARQ